MPSGARPPPAVRRSDRSSTSRSPAGCTGPAPRPGTASPRPSTALGRRDVGDVRNPLLSCSGRREVSGKQVLGNRKCVLRVGRATSPPRMRTAQSGQAHQAGHSLARAAETLSAQRRSEPWGSISPSAVSVQTAQLPDQLGICPCALRRLAIAPSVVSAGGQPHHPAEHLDRVLFSLSMDEPEAIGRDY